MTWMATAKRKSRSKQPMARLTEQALLLVMQQPITATAVVMCWKDLNFNRLYGLTGKAIATTDYDPPRGVVSDWGDSYGNRVDRFLAAVAYLDGEHPSLIFSRGYYTRTVIVAYDFKNGALTKNGVSIRTMKDLERPIRPKVIITCPSAT